MIEEGGTKMLRKTLCGVAAVAMLTLLPGVALAQSGASQPVYPPQQVAQLRQKYEGLTPEQVKAAGYVPEGGCVSNPVGPGAMGIHAMNQQLYGAQFPKGTMDPANPPVLLLDPSGGKVIGLEWEARDVGQGPIRIFGQTVQLQPPHPGVDESHYMLHIYFEPNGKVRFGTDARTEFDPELSCASLPDTGGMVSPVQFGGILAIAGGLALLGVTFVMRRRML